MQEALRDGDEIGSLLVDRHEVIGEDIAGLGDLGEAALEAAHRDASSERQGIEYRQLRVRPGIDERPVDAHPVRRLRACPPRGRRSRHSRHSRRGRVAPSPSLRRPRRGSRIRRRAPACRLARLAPASGADRRSSSPHASCGPRHNARPRRDRKDARPRGRVGQGSGAGRKHSCRDSLIRARDHRRRFLVVGLVGDHCLATRMTVVPGASASTAAPTPKRVSIKSWSKRAACTSAPSGATGFRRRRPGINVEMHPGLGLLDETAQEQGRSDGAGEGPARDIDEYR